ncbi:hypothetical protein BC829DRAFT_395368 [Chytridium lagenaria]|nr:hypothetical protein BC829DRAFT_395368 [Chytridium lagenaria]
MEAQPTLTTLPTEILILSLKYLPPSDILRIACTSYVWTTLLTRRFGKQVLPSSCDDAAHLKSVYKDKSSAGSTFNATLPSVPPGKYIPYFRVQLNASHHLDRIEVGCGVESCDIENNELISSSTKILYHWFKTDPTLPELRIQKEEFSRVRFWMKDQSNEWKFGELFIDSCGLERVDEGGAGKASTAGAGLWGSIKGWIGL